jgi:hypothetical protein
MNRGKLVFAQLMQHLPLTTFRRCVTRYRGAFKVVILAAASEVQRFRRPSYYILLVYLYLEVKVFSENSL